MNEQHRGISVEIHEPAGPDAADAGAAVPVLLLHGIGGAAATFAGVAPLLADAGWRAVAWDAPGYGASADPGPAVTGDDAPGAYVDLVAGLIADLGAEHVHLAGVSWGGVIATHVAARRPELVASLTLIDSTRGSGVTPAKAAAMRARPAELAANGAPAFASGRAPRLLATGADPAVLAEVTRQMGSVRVPGYSGAAEMMAQSDTGTVLPQISAPTLVLVGEEDRVTGVPESELLAREIPGARFATIAHAGHAAIQEQPADIAAAMTAFLTEVESTAPTGAAS